MIYCRIKIIYNNLYNFHLVIVTYCNDVCNDKSSHLKNDSEWISVYTSA